MRRGETRRKVSRQLVNVVNPRLALYTRAGFLAATIMAFNYVFVLILAFVLQRDCTEKTVVDRSLPVTFGSHKTYEEFINLTLSREGVVQEGTTTTTTTISGCVKRNSAVLVAPYMSDTCTDTCNYASDGDCDDGGPGSEYDIESNTLSSSCTIGTDCTDCGIRLRPATYAGTGVTTDVPCWNQYLPCRAQDTATSLCNAETETCLCTDACSQASSGICDDGGPGSEWSRCLYGTDCSDCGPRSPLPPPPPYAPMIRLCTDECVYASNGDCSDGGPGAEFTSCEYGTDCTDCGFRLRLLVPPPPPYAPMTRLCTEACAFASDSDCDDGGPGAEYTNCVYGTDCTDCGFRLPGSCTDECDYASQGQCNDGGPGAEFTSCEYGTDCTDCGFRVMPPPLPPQLPPQSPPQSPAALCNDLCVYASDGDCDDGGPGFEYADCLYGTDCTDCSPRPPDGGPSPPPPPRVRSTGSTNGAQLQIDTPPCGWYKSEEAQIAVGASYRSEMGAKADRFPWCSLEEEAFAIERYLSMSNLTSMDGTRVSLGIRCGFNKMNGYPVTPAGILSPNLSPTPLGGLASGTLTSFTTHWSITATTTTKVCPKFSASFSSAFAFTAQIEIVITLVLIYLFKKSALIGDKKGVFDIGVSGILSHDKASEIEKATQAKREGGAPQTTDRLDGEAARLTPEVQMLIDNAQDNAAANAELMKLVHASCATIEDLRTAIDALKTEVDALRKVTPTHARAVGQEEAKSATRAEWLAHNAQHRSSLHVRSSQPLGLARLVEGLAEGPADGAKPVLQTGPDLSPTLHTPLCAAEGANKEATAASAAAMTAASIVDKAPVRRSFRMKQTVRTVIRRLEEEHEDFGV